MKLGGPMGDGRYGSSPHRAGYRLLLGDGLDRGGTVGLPYVYVYVVA